MLQSSLRRSKPCDVSNLPVVLSQKDKVLQQMKYQSRDLMWKKQHESPETDVKKQRRYVRLVLPQKRLARLLRNVVVLAAPNKSPQFDVSGMPLST
jgi:hypothetical protein